MSNAKQKRAVQAHIEWRKRVLPSNDVTVTRPHEKTVVKVGARVILKKNGKPKKRKGVMVSWRKVETSSRATLVEVGSGFDLRPNHVWYNC